MSKYDISRVKRSKEKAKITYDKLSKWYDLFSGKTENKYRDAGLKKLAAMKGDTVLEIGFGTGRCILALAESVGSFGMVYGIDISKGMCQITRNRVQRAGLSDRVVLECADALNLPFADGFFDAIFMSFTLELFDTPEIPLLLDECTRVLNKVGRICIVALSKEGNHKNVKSFYEWLHRCFPNSFDCRPIYVKRSIENAGFRVLSQDIMYMWGLSVEIVLAEKQSIYTTEP
ncbi:demethylmenaquinone methyltransferase / 2-methoxy-6-polyprenyl-1,4-benzoquinol methylase [Peptoclostridium litorale DSM 5388]|uniref:2-heptaprenyl-1,4-naphthoquinone methyltransferase MenG n=1 Tax=Peptoclostridium litorale DSM 5388 TaxID=1121324 RepID=A0A069RKJ5_PEPLI|nr:methyltransferase domain-containing protein [Peptoclostridium litorale]KDR96630.1 2-heptaprenyl-1,4-naphthoquinone methyltransferase MenG [Peptoclostridium litorale DSM 5388]SIN68279.1 demethylmenaquinone methyltransferase / 2-methoxy-6-polyprenyl-1,4-benzoquinol methylase [Peptoclostridium litorale DSM 5388]